MDRDRWIFLVQLAEEASLRAPDERRAFLSASLEGDAESVEQVLAMLDEPGDESDFPDKLDPALPEWAPESESPADAPLPDRIGPYRVRMRLGEGGMGAVYLVDQETPVKRTVALKVVKAGLHSREAHQRFLYERQALAYMDHPNIAQIYDAGVTPDKAPYLTMEYVPGAPIDRYCRERNLPVEARLELFCQVCAGAEHAHQKGVIHRDLKPSNILVIESADAPVAKIIDFGIAKAVGGQALSDLPSQTRMGSALGTPVYMSPEQADLRETQIDTRTDVYGLGATLYQVLAEATPFERDVLDKASLSEQLRIICEEEPPPPSARVKNQALANRVRGDLDSVVMKSLRKKPDDRYPSAASLARDIQRFLENRPIRARPAGWVRRFRKLVRRNRVVAAASALALVGLLAGAVVSLNFYLETVRARNNAQENLAFLADMFTTVDPDEYGGEVRMLDVLEDAERRLNLEFANRPLNRAFLQLTLARTYKNLDLIDRAQSAAEKACRLYEAELGESRPETAAAILELAALSYYQKKHDRAAALYERAVQIARNLDQPKQPYALRAQWGLATIDKNRAEKLDLRDPRRQALLERAEGRYRRVLASQKIELGATHPHSLQTQMSLANTLKQSGGFQEAEALYLEVIAHQEHVWGSRHSATLSAMNNYAKLLTRMGRHSEAIALAQEVFEIRRKKLGERHRNTLNAMYSFALALWKARRFDEAYDWACRTWALRCLAEDKSDRASDGLARRILFDWQNQVEAGVQ